jgi:hypothetical protein
MVRRTDRPLGQVRVSFETTRLSPQHLIEAYELLAAQLRRSSARVPHNTAELRETKITKANMRRGER